MWLDTRRPPRIITVKAVNGSAVGTRFVTLNIFARPPGPGVPVVNTSGRAETSRTVVLYSAPLLLTTSGYEVPFVGSTGIAGGTTKKTSSLLPTTATDFTPAATPLMLTLTPLSSIGKVKLRWSDPTAVLAVTGANVGGVTSTTASNPGAK